MSLVAKGLNGQVIEPYSFSEEMKFDWSIDDPHVAWLRSTLEREKVLFKLIYYIFIICYCFICQSKSLSLLQQ